MERLIIDGDPGAVEAIPGDVVGRLWDLVQDHAIIISIYVETDEDAINQGNQGVLAFSSEEPATQTVYGVDFGGEEPFNGNC